MVNKTQLVPWPERIMNMILGPCVHSWGFPFSVPGVKYPAPYDSHQTCTACGKRRFFNFQKMEAGPLFRPKKVR
jgi:hypothetical protein